MNSALLATLVVLRLAAILMNVSVIKKQVYTWNWKADRATTVLKRLLFTLTVAILISNLIPLSLSIQAVLGVHVTPEPIAANALYLLSTASGDAIQSLLVWVIYRGCGK